MAVKGALGQPHQFLASQVGLVTPLLFWLVLKAWWRGAKDRDERRWLLLCLGAVPFLLFLLLSLRTRVEGNWPSEAYLAGLLLVAAEVDLRSRLARLSLVLAFAMALVVHWQAARPFLPVPQERAKLDSASRVDGWRDMAAEVAGRRMALGTGSFVGCRTYQIAAELAFYLPDHPRPLIIQNGAINHQYRFWTAPQEHAGADAVLVVGQAWELDEMRDHFRSIEQAGIFQARRHGIVTQVFYFYLGRGFKP